MAFWNLVQGSIKQKIIKQIYYEGLSDQDVSAIFYPYWIIEDHFTHKNRLISILQTKTLLNMLFSVKWLMLI